MFELITIGSGSTGNSYLLKTENEILILECGMPWKKILQALNFNLSGVVGCLVSHEHKDHSASINDVIKSGINVYASAGTVERCLFGFFSHRARQIKHGIQFHVGGYTILPFATQHDAAEPFGFLIQHDEFGKLLFATDTYYIKYRFNGLTHIMIECNYDRNIVEENLRSGAIEKFQVKRLLESHMSLENAKCFLQANDLSRVRKIYLIHLSNRNSDAENFKEQIERLTGIPTEIC